MLSYSFHQVGITPAYAGKRKCNIGMRCPNKDHPRVCGEKQGMPNRWHSA